MSSPAVSSKLWQFASLVVALASMQLVGCSELSLSGITPDPATDTLVETQYSENDTAVELSLPRALVSLRALTPATLSLEVILDGGPPRVFREQQSDVWSISFDAPGGQHVVELRWYENYGGVNLLLASQKLSFSVGTQPVELTLDNPYTTAGPGFDVDGDGSSNLSERLMDTDPLTADLVPVNVNEPELAAIGAGCFIIGSPPEEAGRGVDEAQKSICMDGFSMGKFEVTFSQYDVFAIATGRELPDDYGWGRGNQPVILINWNEALAYTQWLSAQTGRTWRLPTEAEWEYAVRAGTSTPFSTGATIVDEQANFDATATYGGSSFGIAREQAMPIGVYPQNPWGLHDMSGNVAEYTCSARATSYSGNEVLCVDENHSAQIMVRGGSWREAPVNLRSASRDSSVTTKRYFDVGFRVVREN